MFVKVNEVYLVGMYDALSKDAKRAPVPFHAAKILKVNLLSVRASTETPQLFIMQELKNGFDPQIGMIEQDSSHFRAVICPKAALITAV